MDSKHLELIILIARIKHLHQQRIRYKIRSNTYTNLFHKVK